MGPPPGSIVTCSEALVKAEVIRSVLAHDAEVEKISPLDVRESRLVGLLKTYAALRDAVSKKPACTYNRGYASGSPERLGHLLESVHTP